MSSRPSRSRALVLCTLCWLLCPVTGGTQPGPHPPTTPLNGSFENLDPTTGLPAQWTPWTKPVTCSYSLARAHSGVACAQVTDFNPTQSQGLRSARMPINNGHRYRATAFVFVDDLQAGGFALYLEFWAGSRRLTSVSTYTSRRGAWVPLKVEAVAPRRATEATVLIYGSSATVGRAYFDDVLLAELP